MFRSFGIKNFRVFRDLELRPLARVNLIAGRNNTGKTALLEAIRLFCNPNDCRLPLEIDTRRGIEHPDKALEDVVGWLFRDKDFSHRIELAAQDEQGDRDRLTVRVIDTATARQEYGEVEQELRHALPPLAGGGSARRIVLLYDDARGQWVSLGAWVALPGGATLLSFQADIDREVPNTFLSSGPLGAAEERQRFSELEAANRLPEIIANLKVLEPRLRRLALVAVGEEVIVHGDIGLARMLPLALMGEGMRRLFSLLVAVATSAGGVVLLDEIESGLHYSILAKVWQALVQAVRQANVQLFATTQSYECIMAAHEAFLADGPYELQLHRLERVNEDVRVAAYDRDTLATAHDMNHEVR
jgi:predicted ATPase